MTETPAPAGKTIYALHRDTVAARTRSREAQLRTQAVHDALRCARDAEAQAESDLQDAITALLIAPGGMTDHVDALAGALADESPGTDPLTPSDHLREVARALAKTHPKASLRLRMWGSELEMGREWQEWWCPGWAAEALPAASLVPAQ